MLFNFPPLVVIRNKLKENPRNSRVCEVFVGKLMTLLKYSLWENVGLTISQLDNLVEGFIKNILFKKKIYLNVT